MRLLRTRLTLCMSRRNSLWDDRQLKNITSVSDVRKGKIGQTRRSIQLCAKVISVIGYGCCVARQYSRSSSASDIGSVLGLFLKPTMAPLASVGSRVHGWVKFARSTNCRVSSRVRPLDKNKIHACERNGRTGLPRVESSQSRIPITRFSVGWKTRLSSL